MKPFEWSETGTGNGETSSPERIRVAYVIHSLDTGGAERQLLQLISRLDRNVFEPLLITGQASEERGEADCADVLLSEGSSGTDRSAMWKVLSFAARVGRLAKTLHRFRPHVLHAFLPERTLFMSAAAEALQPVPLLIANRRSSVSVYRKSGWKTALERLAMMRVDAMLTNSEALREEVIRVDGFKDAAVIHGGTDTELFYPGAQSDLRREMGWTSKHIVAGMVANFRACKRHEDFVFAAKALHDRHPQMRFVLMGYDRGTLGAVRRQIADLGLTGVLKIISGSLAPETLYPALDMYVCASESEGFPNAVLEAMACGKPVIATKVGGTVEAMEDAMEGLLIPPHDPGAIVAAAERLIGDAQLGRRLGAAARARVQDRYSIDAMVAAHETFYLEQLKQLIPDSCHCPEKVDANETR